MSKISFANSKVTATLKWRESSRKKTTTENNIKECKSKWITKKKVHKKCAKQHSNDQSNERKIKKKKYILAAYQRHCHLCAKKQNTNTHRH